MQLCIIHKKTKLQDFSKESNADLQSPNIPFSSDSTIRAKRLAAAFIPSGGSNDFTPELFVSCKTLAKDLNKASHALLY